MNNPRRQSSLFKKVQGPNAVPLKSLVARGEAVAERVHAQFDSYFQQRVNEVRKIARKLEAEPSDTEIRKDFFYAVQDLRSSSATANKPALSGILTSFADVARSFDPQLKKYFDIVHLHFDALALLTTATLVKPEADKLIKDLAITVHFLKTRQAEKL